MGRAVVRSARIASLLRNRHRTFDELAALPVEQDLSGLEHGDVLLDLADLEVLARFFKRTWPYLLIDEPEPPFGVGRDHRRRAGVIADFSDDLLEALRASEEQLQTIIELFPDQVMAHVDDERALELPSAAGDLFPSAERTGAALRAFLGVTTADHVRPQDEYAALRVWIDALDRRGMYVAQRRLNDSSVRAFSLMREDHGLAVVDTRDSGWARCFSLLHEVVHLQMRSTGLCDLDESSRIERWCNAVAAACLMPVEALAEADLATLGGAPEQADAALRDAARLVGVSQQALLIRLRDLGRLSSTEFDALEQRRAARRAQERSGGGGDYYLNKVVHVGRRFARQVLRAHDDADLSSTEAAAALEVREHQLDGLRRWL